MEALKAKLNEQEEMPGLCKLAVERAQTQIEKSKRPRGPGEVIFPPEPHNQGEATGAKTQAEVVLKDLHLRLQAGAHAFIQNPDEEYNDYVES